MYIYHLDSFVPHGMSGAVHSGFPGRKFTHDECVSVRPAAGKAESIFASLVAAVAGLCLDRRRIGINDSSYSAIKSV